MARARVVLPAPRSPHSATASPHLRLPAMPAPSLAVAFRSASATSPRKVCWFSGICLAFSGETARRKGLLWRTAPHANPAPDLRKSRGNMSEKIVIIGAGQAGAQAVQSLRAEGFTGSITLLGDESFPPYQRPPLSKAYLLGTFER